MNDELYKKFAIYYDKLYSKKNYKKEINFVDNFIKKHLKNKRKTLLDVACGTGNHTLLLKQKGYIITGIDNSAKMLKIAKDRIKKLNFIEADMRNFKLKNKFDVITCLFASINYNQNYKVLKETLTNFYNHLKKTGIIIFDLGINNKSLRNYQNKKPTYYFDKKLKIVRLAQYLKKNNKFLTKRVFMFVKDKNKVIFSINEDKILLININKIKKIMQNIGFQVKIYNNFTFEKFNSKGKKPVFVGFKM